VQLVQPRSPQVAYLSDLTPLGYKQIPLVGSQWHFGDDRDLLGGRLRSGGAIYAKGLAMHSASRLAYDVAGWRRLEGEVALADAAGLQGSVVFKVLLETAEGWRPAYESPVARGGDAPRPFSVELQGAARAALLVEYADRGDVWDHAQWLGIRLVK
jgi:alpha-galactosidase